MGHTAEDVPRFVQRSAPRMKTSCYSAILNKALAFSKLPALAVRIAAPRQDASWGVQAGKGPRPARGPLPRPAQHRRDGRSFLRRNGHGRRPPSGGPHGALSCGRGPAGQGRDRPRADERGSSFSVCRGDMFSRAPLRDASWLQEKPPCPGKRPFLPAPEGRALSCPDCALVRDPFYLMEIIDFWDRGVKTTPRLRDKGRILAAGRPAHIRLAGL